MEAFDFYLKRANRPHELLLDLAGLLSLGNLSLMVGAGASANLGLPLWTDLAKACLNAAGFAGDAGKINSNTPTQKLLDLMGMARSKIGSEVAYQKLVSDSLYAKGLPPVIEASPLLRAIGSLCMGSVRGRVSDIVNYNFDCVLEQYFKHHGYVSQVIADVPTLLRSADIRIWHPHGYLPFDSSFGRPSSRLVFDCDAAEDLLHNREEPWLDVFRFIFGTKVFLAVGLSGNDPISSVVFKAAEAKIATSKDPRPFGFWLHKHLSIEPEILSKLERRRLVPVPFPDYPDIADFLMRICQTAANAVL